MIRRSSSCVWMIVLSCLVAMPTARPVAGQEPSPTAEADATPPQQAPAAAPGQQAPLEVTGVQSLTGKDPNSAKLGDRIAIQVKGLEGWLANSAERCESLVLFLDGMAIRGVDPDSCDPFSGTVYFQLARTDESTEAWQVLLEEPLEFFRQIRVSLGAEGSLAFPTQVRKFRLEVLPRDEFVGTLAGLVLLLIAIVYLARRTNLLRDRAPLGLPPGKFAPFSLSRFQLAFWSFLVISAYLSIWMITGELDTITGSVLALLGIGAGTALGARLIDTGGGATDPTSPDPGKNAAPAADQQPVASKGFLRDVLSDEQGISLYRFQLFIWTLVLGIIFVADVYNHLAMPQFNTTLLGLMGISSGTYLGFKVPENRTPAEADAKG